MATAYTAEMTVAGSDGWRYVYHYTSSDVAGEFWLSLDGQNNIVFPSVHGRVSVIDFIVSSASGTTKNAEIFVNGVSTGLNISLSANLATNLSRQFMGANIMCSPGSKFVVVQRA